MLNSGVYETNLIVFSGGAGVTGVVPATFLNLNDARYIAALAKFVRTSGGTSLDAWLQTSLDGGDTYFDIMHFGFTLSTASKMKAFVAKEQATDLVPGDGVLTSGAIVAILGNAYRWKYTTVGAYVGNLALSFNIGG